MDSRDWLALLGLGLLSGGCYLIFPPLALIVPGAIITHVAIYGYSEQPETEE